MSSSSSSDRIPQLEKEALLLEPSAENFEKLCSEAISFCANFVNEHSKDPKSKSWFDYNPEKVRKESMEAFGNILEKLPPGKDDEKSIFSSENLQQMFQTFKVHCAEKGMIGTSPNFFGYVLGGGLREAALGDFIAAISNRFSGFFAAQPGPVMLENQLVRFLATDLGFLDPLIAKAKEQEEKERKNNNNDSNMTKFPNNMYGAGGYLASGTSVGTVSAFAAAREAHNVFLGTKEYSKAVIYMTKEAHSCLGKAVHLLGCGHVKFRVIPCYGEELKYKTVKATSPQREQASSSANADPCLVETRYLAMDVPYLEKQMQEDVEVNGLKPWIVVGSAGTVNTGALDELDRIGKLAKKYSCWFHVDGAYGGSFAILWKKILEEEEENNNSKEKNKDKTTDDSEDSNTNNKENYFMSVRYAVETIRKGFALADSACVDQHKGFALPFGTGLCLVKDIQLLAKAHDKTHASYLHDFLKDAHQEVNNKKSSNNESESSTTTNNTQNNEDKNNNNNKNLYPIIQGTDFSPELSHHNRTLRLYIPLQLFGMDPFRSSLYEKILIARYFAIRLREAVDEQKKKNPAFPRICIIPPQLSVVAFRIADEDEDENVNESILKEPWNLEESNSPQDDNGQQHYHHVQIAGDGAPCHRNHPDPHSKLHYQHEFNVGTNRLEKCMFKRGNSFASPTTLAHGKIRWLRACFLNFRSHRVNADQLVDEVIFCTDQSMKMNK